MRWVCDFAAVVPLWAGADWVGVGKKVVTLFSGLTTTASTVEVFDDSETVPVQAMV